MYYCTTYEHNRIPCKIIICDIYRVLKLLSLRDIILNYLLSFYLF